jgi:hypothetical protein
MLRKGAVARMRTSRRSRVDHVGARREPLVHGGGEQDWHGHAGGRVHGVSDSDGELHADTITAGADGNLWFTEYDGSKIGRVTPAGVFTEFPTPTANSGPKGIAAGPDGNIWFTEYARGEIGKVTPAGVFTEFLIPSPGNYSASIAAGAFVFICPLAIPSASKAERV